MPLAAELYAERCAENMPDGHETVTHLHVLVYLETISRNRKRKRTRTRERGNLEKEKQWTNRICKALFKL